MCSAQYYAFAVCRGQISLEIMFFFSFLCQGSEKISIVIFPLKSFNISFRTPEQVLLLLYSVQFFAQKMLHRNLYPGQLCQDCTECRTGRKITITHTPHEHLLPDLTVEEVARVPDSTVGCHVAFRQTRCPRLRAHRAGSRWRNAGLRCGQR